MTFPPRPPLSSVRRPFLWALALSFLVHLVLLFGARLALPTAPEEAPPIQARLEKLPLPPRHKPRPVIRPHPRPAAPRVATAATPEPPVPVAPAPAKDAAPPAPPAPPPFDAARVLPLKAELRYRIYQGGDRFYLGTMITALTIADGRYTFRNTFQGKGLAALFLSGEWYQQSEGTVDAAGLHPEHFVERKGKKEPSEARFDWAAQRLTLTGGRVLPLPDKTQDMVTFTYQFAFDPPARGEVRFPFTNGRKLDQYVYDVVGQEDVETPVGKVHALHLAKRHGAGEEGTEIWLDVDNHYLPVMVRQLAGDGSTQGEQIVESIVVKETPP